MNQFFKFKNLFCILLLFCMFIGCDENNPEIRDNLYNGRSSAVFNAQKKYGKVTDIDGNIYRTIVIGEQTWMAENLRTTRYLNGDAILNITDTTEWVNTVSGAYCTYSNTSSIDTIATYGLLYNWYAIADSRNLAPKGWRMPTIADWDQLIDYLGGDTIASFKLKEAGIQHWNSQGYADNSSGFTALPGGRRYLTWQTNDIGYNATFWAMPEYNQSSAGFISLFYASFDAHRGINFKSNGYSIRCIKER